MLLIQTRPVRVYGPQSVFWYFSTSRKSTYKYTGGTGDLLSRKHLLKTIVKVAVTLGLLWWVVTRIGAERITTSLPE